MMHRAFIFEQDQKGVKLVRNRSNFNFFIFHLSSSTMQAIRTFS